MVGAFGSKLKYFMAVAGIRNKVIRVNYSYFASGPITTVCNRPRPMRIIIMVNFIAGDWPLFLAALGSLYSFDVISLPFGVVYLVELLRTREIYFR